MSRKVNPDRPYGSQTEGWCVDQYLATRLLSLMLTRHLAYFCFITASRRTLFAGGCSVPPFGRSRSISGFRLRCY
jgi:hypothetical protein